MKTRRKRRAAPAEGWRVPCGFPVAGAGPRGSRAISGRVARGPTAATGCDAPVRPGP